MFKIKYIRNFVSCIIAYLRLQCVHMITWNENTKRSFFMHCAKSCLCSNVAIHRHTFGMQKHTIIVALHTIGAFNMDLIFSWIPANRNKDRRIFKREWRLSSELSVVSFFTCFIYDKLISNVYEILSVEKVSKCVFLSLSSWYTLQAMAGWFLLNLKLTNVLCAVHALFRKTT